MRRAVSPPARVQRPGRLVRQFTPNLLLDVGAWSNRQWLGLSVTHRPTVAHRAYIDGDSIWVSFGYFYWQRFWAKLEPAEVAVLARECHDPEVLVIVARLNRGVANASVGSI